MLDSVGILTQTHHGTLTIREWSYSKTVDRALWVLAESLNEERGNEDEDVAE